MLRCLSPRMLGLRLDARSTIARAARSGFDGAELLVRDIMETGDDPEELAALMAGLGLRPVSWPLPVDWRGDEGRFLRDLERLPAYARLAARLGLDRTGTWVLPEIVNPDALAGDNPIAAALEMHLDRLDRIAAILTDHGQRLGLEAIGVPLSRTGLGLPFLHRLDALDPLTRALRARGRDVGVIVDAFHLYAAGEEPTAAIGLGVDAIVAVHLSDIPEGEAADPAALRDDRRSLPRAGGTAPCAELLRLCANAGYTGPVFAEPRPGVASIPREEGADVDHIGRAAEALRSVWPTN